MVNLSRHTAYAQKRTTRTAPRTQLGRQNPDEDEPCAEHGDVGHRHLQATPPVRDPPVLLREENAADDGADDPQGYRAGRVFGSIEPQGPVRKRRIAKQGPKAKTYPT
jgi:hypothetical protein